VQKSRPVRRWSLRTKISAWVLIPTAIILAVVAWATLYAYQRLTEDLVIERNQELTRLIADQLAREMTEDIELLTLFARPHHTRDPLTEQIVFHRVSSIVRPRIGVGGSAYVVDSDGHIIYHSDITHIGQDVSERFAVRQALAQKTGALRTRDQRGREIVASYAPVPDTAWGLITEESWTALIHSSQNYRRSLLLLLALGVVAPILAIAIGVRRITRPIADLMGAAQKVAAGNFDHTINVATGDELEELARQFNRMTEHIQASHADLERKVVNRTQELAALYAIASSVNRSLAPDQTLDRALDELMALLDMEVGEIRLLDEARNRLDIRSQRGLSPDFVRDTDRRAPSETLPGRVLLSGRAMFLENLAQSPNHAWAQREDLRAIAVCPLRAREKRLGTLSLATRRGPRPFSPNERELLRAASDQAAIAIENAQLYQQAQQFAVVEERNRLARDLHDSVTQSLYGVTLFSEAAERLLLAGDTRLAATHLHDLQQTAQEALREMRLLIFELRPPILGQKGLVAALQTRLEAVEGRAGLQTTLHVEGDDRRLAPEVEEGLYRIAQEALNNALKHARAQRIDVYLCQEPARVVLQVADDGVGLDLATAHLRGGLGLRGMEERATQLGAQLSVQGRPGQGTQIRVEVHP